MMQKTSGTNSDLTKLTLEQKMQFPDKIKFIKQGRRYVVTQTVKTASQVFKRVVCLDGGDDSVMQLRILKDEVTSAKSFAWID